MNCPDCTEAAARQWHGYTAGCRGCTLRGLASGPDYARVKQSKSLDSTYLRALAVFGVTHAEVKHAAGDA
jgi:hypothetical protein